MFLGLEFCLIVIFVALALMTPQAGEPWFAAVERQLSEFAKKRALATFSVGVLALGMRLAMLPILPVPYPEVTDEYHRRDGRQRSQRD